MGDVVAARAARCMEYGPPFAKDCSFAEAVEACRKHFVEAGALSARYQVEVKDQDTNGVLYADLVLSEMKVVWGASGTIDEVLRELNKEDDGCTS